ncbi:threonine aldolase family protein [Planctomycetota bacterium]
MGFDDDWEKREQEAGAMRGNGNRGRFSDFRSDTVTRPTVEMRRAMAEAEVGDDVFGDDPTVNRLEAEAARIFGKQAGLFLPSGTMANLVAVMVHCRPGEEALVEERSHPFRSEQGGAARFAGVQLRGLAGDPAGRFDVDQVADEITGGEGAPMVERLHCSRTALVVIENTHNFAGGRVQPLALVQALSAAVRSRGARVHLDGARIMNAVVATGIAPDVWAAAADTVMCSLSKGLCAPVGSVLVGDSETIAGARLARKALGGGMRQAGVLAAPGLLALTTMVDRLAEDHDNARCLAEGLAGVSGVEVEVGTVETNMVFCRLEGGARAHEVFAGALLQRGVGCSPLGALGVRFVTHRDVDGEDVGLAIQAASETVAQGFSA